MEELELYAIGSREWELGLYAIGSREPSKSFEGGVEGEGGLIYDDRR